MGMGSHMGRKVNVQNEAVMNQHIVEQEDAYMTDAEKLIESWEKKEGMGLGNGALASMVADNPYQAVALVKYLENTEKSLARLPIWRLNEYQQSSYMGITPQEIVKVFRFSYGNSIAPSLFNFWAMDSVKDTFYKIETKYGTTDRGATSGQTIYENFNDGRYPTSYEQETFTGDGSTANFTGTLSVLPALAYQIRIFNDQTPGGAQIGGDDGNGTITSITGATLGFSGTINYTTGAYDITFDSAPASGAIYTIEYAFDAEDEDLFSEVGTVSLNLVAYDFRGVFSSLKAEWHRMTEEVSQSKLGRSARQDLLDGIADVMKKSYDEFYCTRAIKASQWASAITFDTNYSNNGADSFKANVEALPNSLEEARGVTYNALGRFASRTNLLVGYKAKAYMRNLDGYQVNSNRDEVGFFKDGSFQGYDVFVGPADVVSASDIYLFGRGKDAMSTDAVMSVGVFKGDITSDELEYASFKNSVGFGNIGDWKITNRKMATKVTLENL